MINLVQVKPEGPMGLSISSVFSRGSAIGFMGWSLYACRLHATTRRYANAVDRNASQVPLLQERDLSLPPVRQRPPAHRQ